MLDQRMGKVSDQSHRRLNACKPKRVSDTNGASCRSVFAACLRYMLHMLLPAGDFPHCHGDMEFLHLRESRLAGNCKRKADEGAGIAVVGADHFPPRFWCRDERRGGGCQTVWTAAVWCIEHSISSTPALRMHLCIPFLRIIRHILFVSDFQIHLNHNVK